jgi:hypothetical protein
VICPWCEKTPDQIQEFIDAAKENVTTPEEYVRTEEGTYNPENGHFCCTNCYIAIGMPSRPGGWKAP